MAAAGNVFVAATNVSGAAGNVLAATTNVAGAAGNVFAAPTNVSAAAANVLPAQANVLAAPQPVPFPAESLTARWRNPSDHELTRFVPSGALQGTVVVDCPQKAWHPQPTVFEHATPPG